MKFIARHLNLIGLLMLVAFGAAAAGLYFNVPERLKAARVKAASAPTNFTCPMHPKVTSAKPGNCSECGMKLVTRATGKTTQPKTEQGGCCAAKAPVAEPPPAAVCPHLAAQAAQDSSCCPKPANP